MRARGVTGAALIAACLLGSATASAGEPTREEFVAAAERECRAGMKVAVDHFKRSERLLDDGRSNAGANHAITGYRVLVRSIRDVKRIPPPPADERAVRRWLSGELRSLDLWIKSWSMFKRGASERQTDRVWQQGEKIHRAAHRAVKGFGFKTCA
jgi:hypothetical protein